MESEYQFTAEQILEMILDKILEDGYVRDDDEPIELAREYFEFTRHYDPFRRDS